MRIAIVGAGAVGRSIAQALLDHEHKVLLIERRRHSYRPRLVPDADWMLADACEMNSLETAGIGTCDGVMAASGDDQVNLVFSFLTKTEYGVPRVVARINDPDNEWMFTGAWGVDVAVSTPRAIAAGVEDDVTVGDIVRLITLMHGRSQVMEVTLPPDTFLSGTRVGDLTLPSECGILSIFRGTGVLQPKSDTRLTAGDRVLIAAAAELQFQIRETFSEPD
ncbi:MAG TPA: TrkA family potassium uptake protein [Frankiaceae bacterium]|jgi:trk system potassium uptake protein TrkA|nr:TrkA family potassium uptake protein [Frankiaceae bacterium]